MVLPGAEKGEYELTEKQQQDTLRACQLERSIHRNSAKKQHMFRVRSPLPDFSRL